nr:hypothetical protein [Tanacetum cinerariifolium]
MHKERTPLTLPWERIPQLDSGMRSLHLELLGPEDPIVEFPEDMDLFSLISAPNHAKVKTETRPRAAHEVPLLNATANRVIDMEDMIEASGSLGTPSIEKSNSSFGKWRNSEKYLGGAMWSTMSWHAAEVSKR